MNFKFKIWIFDYQFVPDHSKRFQTFPNHNKQNNLFSAPVFLILAATTLFILIIGTFALMHYHRKQLFKIKQNRFVKQTFLEYNRNIREFENCKNCQTAVWVKFCVLHTQNFGKFWISMTVMLYWCKVLFRNQLNIGAIIMWLVINILYQLRFHLLVKLPVFNLHFTGNWKRNC